MTRSCRLVSFLALLAVAGASGLFAARPATPARQAAPRPLALVGGTLVDGFGSTPIRNSVVLVEGERIKAVGQVGALAVPAGVDVISTEGMTVLPGLWDLHVHLMYAGHPDARHWFDTYTPQFETVIIPASAETEATPPNGLLLSK